MSASVVSYKSRKGDPEIIARLAAGATVKEAAAAAGVSDRTVFRRLQDPSFRREVSAVRRLYIGETVGRLVDAGSDAAATLKELLNARSENVKHSAARTILEMSQRMFETEELVERIEALELAETERNGT